jgi:hypothetical protein
MEYALKAKEIYSNDPDLLDFIEKVKEAQNN